MRNILIFFSVLIIHISYAQKDAIKVVYEVSSRGYSKKIEISKDNLIRTLGVQHIKRDTLTSNEIIWNKVNDLINEINLQEMANLKAPTERRFYDGAPHANLKIWIGKRLYVTPYFDHGFPPNQIKKIVKYIVELGEF